MTVFNGASSQLTLKIMLGVTLCCIPVVIAYQAWVYYTFAHKVTPKASRRTITRIKLCGGGEKEPFWRRVAFSPSPLPHPPKTFDWWGGGAEESPFHCL